MKKETFYYILLVAFIVACGVFSSAAVSAYLAKEAKVEIVEKSLLQARQPERAAGIWPVAISLVVYEVNEKEGTILGIVQSRLAGQEIPMKIKMGPAFYIERSDAVVKDGLVVGALPAIPATISDLKRGTKAYAMVNLSSLGETVASYMIIGDPFPRP